MTNAWGQLSAEALQASWELYEEETWREEDEDAEGDARTILDKNFVVVSGCRFSMLPEAIHFLQIDQIRFISNSSRLK
jgi:hypothetical protein